MTPNVGRIDRLTRLLAGSILVLIALFAPLDPIWRIIFVALAAIAFITAFFRF
jgi:hypothetical protein